MAPLYRQTCPICLETGCNTRLSPCRHGFHRACIRQWSRHAKQQSCPSCNRPTRSMAKWAKPRNHASQCLTTLNLDSLPRPCPGCGILIEHIDGCPIMDCTWCGTQFNYRNGFIISFSTRDHLQTRTEHDIQQTFWENWILLILCLLVNLLVVIQYYYRFARSPPKFILFPLFLMIFFEALTFNVNISRLAILSMHFGLYGFICYLL